jgi:hypothetical protein
MLIRFIGNKIGREKYLGGIGLLWIVLCVGPVCADTLLTLPGSIESGSVNGIISYVDLNDSGTYDGPMIDYYACTINLDYAVFKDSILGQDYPGQYIYAYQFFNVDGYDPINTLTVGINTNSTASAGYSIADPTPTYPTSHAPSSFTSTTNSRIWNFDTVNTMVLPGEQSNILYFTSPLSPGIATAGFAGGCGVTITGIPSPVPEPATASMLVLVALSACFGGLLRRAHGQRRF